VHFTFSRTLLRSITFSRLCRGGFVRMLAVSCLHKFGSIRLRGGVVSRSHSSLSKPTDTSISLHPRARVAIYGRSRPLRTLHFYLQVPLRSLWWARARAWVLTRVPRRSASLTFVGLWRWKASMRTSARSSKSSSPASWTFPTNWDRCVEGTRRSRRASDVASS